MAFCSLGSFKGTAVKDVDLVSKFKEDVFGKGITPLSERYFSIKKIAIEAPEGSVLTINDVEITMPSTGILEFGMNYIAVNSLIFAEDTDVNIVYLY